MRVEPEQRPREAGREKFHNALRAMVRGRAFGSVTIDDLRAAVEREAGRDCGWFFEQWMARTGAPRFELA